MVMGSGSGSAGQGEHCTPQGMALRGTSGAGMMRSLVDNERCAETGWRQKEVDELRETLHNLASLLLTNTTIRKRSKAVPNTVL
jgi:hypothetical protein